MRSVATNISEAAASDIGNSAINAAKTVGKELASSAISTAKDIAIDKGKQLITKFNTNASSKALSNASSKPELTQESKDILASLARRIAQPLETSSPAQNSETATNLNRLLAGQGLDTNRTNAVKIQRANAVRIQDIVRTLNGGGLRLA